MSEIRRDPVSGRWVIISPQRAKRPQEFYSAETETDDPASCPFCEGKEEKTPEETFVLRKEDASYGKKGWKVRIVPNLYPALSLGNKMKKEGSGLYEVQEGIGLHEIIIESPRHETFMSHLSKSELHDVFSAFQIRMKQLETNEQVKYVLIYKNEGERAGATLKHTHSQLMALPMVPEAVCQELTRCEDYYSNNRRCLFCDILHTELKEKSRIILENNSFIALCPFAPRFPYETWFLPKEHEPFFEKCDNRKIEQFAEIFKMTLKKLEAILGRYSYNLVIHTSPKEIQNPKSYHWHIELTPRLTRIAGFESGSGFYINVMSPESSAEALRKVS